MKNKLTCKDAVVPANQRGLVKARDADIDLSQKLGKTQVISANTPLSQQGGYPHYFVYFFIKTIIFAYSTIMII